MKTRVIIKEHKEYILDEIVFSIREFFNEFDLFDKLKDKKLILLKPNLLGAHHPDKAVTTHPVVLEALIMILKDMEKEIIVGDSPGGTAKASVVWKTTGIQEICERHNVRLIDFGKEGIINIQTNLTKFFFDKYIIECDAIINLAKMKTHSLMLYTGAVKNLYGAIPGLYKSELHKQFPSPKEFSSVLSAIYGLLKPSLALNIIDGIIGMEGDGPSAGKPYPFGVLIASEIASATDFVASGLMGFDVDNIVYLKQSLQDDEVKYLENDIDILCREKKLNLQEIKEILNYKKINIKSVIFSNNLLDKLPKFIKNIFKALLDYYPDFNKECQMCLVCAQSCPVQALDSKGNELILNKKKCIKCLCCHEMCQYNAIFLKKRFLAKIIYRNIDS
ncbi:MAG: DUF362 domain-containing protein [Candidatus Cloacimonetes bacterium]|nr:DUF362 domain-containing protein [Candidatus Cloacimonadota bacterium]